MVVDQPELPCWLVY